MDISDADLNDKFTKSVSMVNDVAEFHACSLTLMSMQREEKRRLIIHQRDECESKAR
jgi:hypothetical protein